MSGKNVIIAELAERSPITIQNSGNPSSPKNLVLLLACATNYEVLLRTKYRTWIH